MPIDFPLASGLTSLTIVTGVADRALRFPSPNVNQLVYNLGTLAIERWNGAAWVQDILFAGTTEAETFNGLIVAAAGLVASGPGTASGYADYLVLNALRLFTGFVGLSLYGANATGTNDVRLYNDGSGNTNLSVGGVQVLQIDRFGNITMNASTLLWSAKGAHQIVDGWSITNPAANLSNTLLTRTPAEWFTDSAGLITGLAIRASGAMTGGTATITVFDNGAATAMTLTTTIGASYAQFRASQINQAVSVTAGDTYDIRLSTSSGWTFTTGTVQAVFSTLI